MSIRVLLVDDEELIRSGMRLIIESQEDIRVVGEAANGRSAIDQVKDLAPDVVLMDIQMPEMTGIEATAEISRSTSAPRIVILTTFGDDEHVFAALRAGASAFVLKDSRAEDVISAIRVVAGGEALLSPRVTRGIVDRFVAAPPPSAPEDYARLTDREKEILVMVAAGMSNQEIADEAFIGFSTAKTHVSSILSKLGLRDRVHAVIYVYQHGLAGPPRG